MFEALVGTTAKNGLFALAKGVRGGKRVRIDPRLVVNMDERGDDLPCPWCYSPTAERDDRCGGCGRLFG